MQEAKTRAYHYLPAPNPIQNKQPIQSNSLLDFVLSEPGNIMQTANGFQKLQKISQRLPNKRNIHQIGNSLTQLFSNPVYQVHSSLNMSNNYTFCSCSTDPQYQLHNKKTIKFSESQLKFQSRFQSGNLALASAVPGKKNQYYLALQRDINSQSVTIQWFYFKVSNQQNKGIFTFHIVNYTKPFSMFKIGMLPSVYSVKKNVGWQRDGFGINYRQNSIEVDEQKFYYTFSFSYKFTQQNDQVFFAYCYPYTYTRIQRFLDNMQVRHSDKLRRKVITKTHGGNVVEMVSITNPQLTNKRSIVITARAHPGQTVSSFVCQGIIQFLLSAKPQAQKLRNQFIIKIIPMLNPDGVINGNYRTSLSGDDLNRQWKNPSKTRHPQIFASKKVILESQYKKMLFIDLHGHSKKRSTFMYGCLNPHNPYVAKQFPYVLYKKMSNFSYFNCNFFMSKSKQGTARITLYRCDFQKSYTYQISFCGPIKQKRHFNIKDLKNMGHQLSQNMSNYFYSRILQLENNEDIKQHCQQFYNDEQIVNLGNYETNGSSSELEDQQIYESIDGNIQNIKNCRKRKSVIKSYRPIKYDVKHKVPGHQVTQVIYPKKTQVQYEAYLKHRLTYRAVKVNIQQIESQRQMIAANSSSFALVSDRRNMIRADRSMSLKRKIDLSSSSNKIDSSQLFGVLTTNSLKRQYKRYQRDQKSKSVHFDKAPSLRVQNLIQGSTATAYGQFRMGLSSSKSMRRSVSRGTEYIALSKP